MTKYVAFQMYKGCVYLDPIVPFTGPFDTKEEARQYCHKQGREAAFDWGVYAHTQNIDGFWVHEENEDWEDYHWAMTFDAIEETE